MLTFDLEQAIAEWRRQMVAAGIKTPVPLEELESHLRDEIERRTKSGLSETEAFKTAIQKIGQAHVVQNEFKEVEEEREAGECKLLKALFVVLTSSAALGMGCMALFKFSFAARFIVGIGLGFELPVILLALVKSGILSYEKLARLRRYALVWNLILGALLTTPEVLTQVIMAVALQVLYEVSARIAWYWERQEKKTERG
ncbi:MAG TPA: twin-arginine translocase subunit TatC [Candidatus Acidoferrum sp.]|nr:twin-arginine translocase subunit TatC [Candidatus Acidoferrum sp.]